MDKRRSIQNYKIALYIRVSTEEQAENPEGSIKNQEERLRLHVKLKNAERHFGDIVEVFVDAGLSAKNMNRPAFQRMLTAIKEKQVDLLMVTELSRLSRSIKDFCEIKDLLSEHGCDFKSLREDFDSSTASGEAMIFNFINMAQFERRQISERVSAGFLSRARRGLFNGGPVPVGYKPTGDRTGRLEVVPEEAATVQTAFKAFLEHRTLTEACKWLNENGYTLPKIMRNCGSYRSGYFLYDTLHTILRNKTYVGIKVFKVGKEKQETKGAWPPIIDEITFNRVQEILTKNNKGRKKSPRENRYPYILSGLVVCGKCGEKLCGKSANGEAGKIAYYDHSYSTKRQGTLINKSFNCRPMRFLAKRLEPIVWQSVIDLLSAESMAADLIAKVNEHHKGGDQKKERERLKDKIYGLNSQMDALTERLSQLPKEVSATPIFKQMQKLEVSKAELEQLVLKFDNALLTEDRPVSIGEYNELLNVLRNDVASLTDEKSKVNLIERLVHKVEVFDTEVCVQFYTGAKKIKRELALTGSLSLKNSKSSLSNTFISSTSLTYGEACPPENERLYPSDIRPHFFKSRNRISSETIELIIEKYKSGSSLGQIAKLVGYSKGRVRTTLRREKGIIRQFLTQETNSRGINSFKQSALPYYGFCYLYGQILKDPKEFPVLAKIHFMWSQGRTPHEITKALNQANMPSRKGKVWSWAAVKNILIRFDQGKLILAKGGKYEFR